MKKQAQRVSRSGLLLTETLLAILFFSIASAICLQLFAKTHVLNRRTQGLDLAVTQSNSVAQLIQASAYGDNVLDSVYETIRNEYPNAAVENNRILIYYTEDGTTCSPDEAIYMLAVNSPNNWCTTNGEVTFPNTCTLRMCDLSYDPGAKEYEFYSFDFKTYHRDGEEVLQ